jgi:aspartyl-tRNA synthetase
MIVEQTIVDQLYAEFQNLVSYLNEQSEISFRVLADANFRKALLLAAASYFERRVCDEILSFVKETSSNNEPVVELVKNKAISRQYHTFFNWESPNANTFFSMFGESFKTFMADEVKNNGNLAEAIRAFIEIGRERNRLVHQDFGTFSLEKTTEEIYQLYRTALPFVQSIPEKLRSWKPDE